MRKGTLAWEDQWKGETLWAIGLAIFYPRLMEFLVWPEGSCNECPTNSCTVWSWTGQRSSVPRHEAQRLYPAFIGTQRVASVMQAQSQHQGPCLSCRLWMLRHTLTMLPIGSMYAIYGNIYHQYTPNVSIYTIHGSYGYYVDFGFGWFCCFFLPNFYELSMGFSSAKKRRLCPISED